MNSLLYLLFLCTLGISHVNLVFAQENDIHIREILDNMFNAADTLRDVTYQQQAWERFDNKLVFSESFNKISITPFKLYAKNYVPNEGAELLYDASLNSKALINPNGFPWFNIYLDANGSILRNNNHHSFFESGYNYSLSIIKEGLKKVNLLNNFGQVFQYMSDTVFDGKACYVIEISTPNYRVLDYTVSDNEDVVSIARKNYVGEYKLMDMNPVIDDYDELNKGLQIKVPSAYAKKTVLYIDKKKFYIISQMIFDENGLYERYDYLNLTINPVLSDKEFSPEYEEYGF